MKWVSIKAPMKSVKRSKGVPNEYAGQRPIVKKSPASTLAPVDTGIPHGSATSHA